MDRIRALFEQLWRFFAGLPPARRVAILGTAVLVLGGTLAFALWVQRPVFRVLYADLDPEDAGRVLSYLKDEKIPYRVEAGGRSIEVPAGRVYEARMALAAQGVPRGGGVGFELFDRQTLGMTDFVQRLGFQRALQGELARSIAELDPVAAARVHLALPRRSVFVSKDRAPTASVVVRLRPGRTLDAGQVGAIVHLVASSVEGLRPSAVTVVDTRGRVLSDEEGRGDAAGPRGLLGLQARVEQSYVDRIEAMLQKILGPGHAIARVTVELDRTQVERTEESYDPEGTAVRSERRSVERSREPGAQGVPGAAAALTNETKAEEKAGATSEREESSLSYEVSRRTSHVLQGTGGVRRLSVAVLVDGKPSGEAAQHDGQAASQAADGGFVPRPTEELERYRELIKRAVGFDESRGDEIEVVSVPFQAPEPEALEAPGWLERIAPWSDVLLRALGLVAVLLVALLVVRPWLLAMVERSAPAAGGAPYAAVEPEARPALPEPPQQSLSEVVRSDPQKAAVVIKQWVTEGS